MLFQAEKRVKLPIKDLDTQPEWMIRSELLPLQLEALNKLRRLWHSRMNGILVYEASQVEIRPNSFICLFPHIFALFSDFPLHLQMPVIVVCTVHLYILVQYSYHALYNICSVLFGVQEKIVMTIMFFLSLVEDYRVAHPILVVVPKSLIQNWEHELYQWAPKLYVVNYASKMEDARGIIRRTEFSSFSEPFKPQIVLTTFEVVNCVRPSNEVILYLVY